MRPYQARSGFATVMSPPSLPAVPATSSTTTQSTAVPLTAGLERVGANGLVMQLAEPAAP